MICYHISKLPGIFYGCKYSLVFKTPCPYFLLEVLEMNCHLLLYFYSAVLVNPIFMTFPVFTLILIFLPKLYSSQTDRSDQLLLVSINWVNYVRVYSTGMNMRN